MLLHNHKRLKRQSHAGNLQIIKESAKLGTLAEAKFFICGIPSFMAGILQALGELWVVRLRIYLEEFGF